MSFLLYAFVLPKLPFVVYHRTGKREQTDHPTGFIEDDPDVEPNHNHTETSDTLDADQISDSHQLQVRHIHDCFYLYITHVPVTTMPSRCHSFSLHWQLT